MSALHQVWIVSMKMQKTKECSMYLNKPNWQERHQLKKTCLLLRKPQFSSILPPLRTQVQIRVSGQFAPQTIRPQFLDNSSPMWKHQSYWFTKEKESATALASQSTELCVSIVDETRLSTVKFIILTNGNCILSHLKPKNWTRSTILC